MLIARRLARPLLASIFIYGGLDAVRHPAPKVPAADTVAADVAAKVPGISTTEQLVRLDGAVKIAAGVALAAGKVPRLAALILLTSLVPTTAAGHRFWEEKDPAKRKAQQLHFVKNAAIAGGLLLAAVDTEGKPSVGWRARRAARGLGQTLAISTPSAGSLTAGASAVSHLATNALQSAGAAADSASGVLESLTEAISDKMHDVTDAIQQRLPS
jgi:putative oxidoreductase